MAFECLRGCCSLRVVVVAAMALYMGKTTTSALTA